MTKYKVKFTAYDENNKPIISETHTVTSFSQALVKKSKMKKEQFVKRVEAKILRTVN
jgi:hypothetical protein